MPWQGQQDNLIDRFDVRAHLDFIPPAIKQQSETQDDSEITPDERYCNYERYRILAQNDFLTISEEKFLNQLYLEEQFGVNAQYEMDKTNKKPKGIGAAIGYTYDDSETMPFVSLQNVQTSTSGSTTNKEEGDSDSDLDVDVAIDISKLDTSQAHELNACGRGYGMKSNDFYSFLTKDADEAETLRMAREEEAEKILLSGRKSRRERRAQRDKRLPGRTMSPPSYAAKEEPDLRIEKEKNESESRSPSPDNSGKVIYITSFGGEDELQPHPKISINFNTKLGSNKYPENSLGSISYAEKVKQNLEKLKKINNISNATSSMSSSSSSRRQRNLSKSRSKRRSRSRQGHRALSRDRYHRYHRSPSYRRSSRSSRYSQSSRSKSRTPIKYKRKISSSSVSSSSTSSRSSSTSTTSSSSSSTSTRSNRSPLPSVIKVKLKNLENLKKSKSKSPPPLSQPPPTLISLQSKIKEKEISELLQPKEEPPPIKRYYGRKKEDQSSSEEDESEEINNIGLSGNGGITIAAPDDEDDDDDSKDVNMASPK